MIARIWHGWTATANAAAYENLLRTEVLPGIAARGMAGYRGAHLLRRTVDGGVEFTTVCWFDSMDAVREFAGPDFEAAVVPSAARALLLRFDARSQHHDAVDLGDLSPR